MSGAAERGDDRVVRRGWRNSTALDRTQWDQKVSKSTSRGSVAILGVGIASRQKLDVSKSISSQVKSSQVKGETQGPPSSGVEFASVFTPVKRHRGEPVHTRDTPVTRCRIENFDCEKLKNRDWRRE